MSNEELERILNDEWMSPIAAARELGVGEQQILHLVNTGRLEAIRVPVQRGARIISTASVRKLLDERTGRKAA